MSRRGAHRVGIALMLVVSALVASAGCSPGTGDERPGPSAPTTASCTDERPALRSYDGAVAELTVASFNDDRTGRPRAIAAEVRRLLGRGDVELVGWQEADTPGFARAARSVPGWRTQVFDAADGQRQVPISWRTSRWALLATAVHPMTGGAGRDVTDHPFRPKWATAVTLRHRATGRVVTLLDTHVPNHIETGDRWEDNVNARAARQHYRRLATLLGEPGGVRLATGDFQWDHRDDVAARPRGGLTDVFAGRARSSFGELGLTGVCATRNTRWIDYVWLDEPSLAAGRAGFVTHRSLDGYASDHRPMLATIALLPRR